MNKGSRIIRLPKFLSDFYQNVPNCAGSKTFEVYMLAAGYKRDKADSKVPGMGGGSWSAFGERCPVVGGHRWPGLEIRSFFEDTWRLGPKWRNGWPKLPASSGTSRFLGRKKPVFIENDLVDDGISTIFFALFSVWNQKKGYKISV